MKLQLQQQTLRLRIDEAEFAALQDGACLEQVTTWPGGSSWRLSLQASDAKEWALTADSHFGVRVSAPRAQLQDYARRLPCRDGIDVRLPFEATVLELSLEVDVRDSVRTRGAAARRRPTGASS